MSLRNLILITAALAGVLVGPAEAQRVDRYERLQLELSSAERKAFERLSVMSRRSLDAMAEATAPEAIRQGALAILSEGSLAVGTRPTDPNGLAPVHRHILERVDRLRRAGADIEYLGSLEGLVAAPNWTDRLEENRDLVGPELSVGGRSWAVTPLWPNGAMPSLCPDGGLTGPLVYVGTADWDDLRGLKLDGAIALMDFRGSRRWERLFSFGCQAVIVIEDAFVNRENAEGLACNTPVPCPRFYVDRQSGRELIARATRKVSVGQGRTRVIAGREAATLRGGSTYEQNRWSSPLVYLPPTAPVSYTVADDDLLTRIAEQEDVSLRDLLAANRLQPGQPIRAGQRLTIPGRVEPYVVGDRDLLERIAADFDVSADQIIQASSSLTGGDALEPGMQLTIPNAEDTLVVCTPIDAANILVDAGQRPPAERPGAKVANQLSAVLAMMDHLAGNPSAVRRKGVLFAFLDAESIGGLSSRAFAEYVLQARGQWQSRLKAEKDPAVRIQRYRPAARWIDAMESIQLDGEVAQWLVQKWLVIRAENARVGRFESRNEQIRARSDLRRQLEDVREAGDSDEVARLEERIEQLTRRIEADRAYLDHLLTYREKTLDDSSKSWQERAEAFLQGLPATPEQAADSPFDLDFQSIRRRLLAELAEETLRQGIHENNLATIERVLERLHPEASGESIRPKLGWYMHLTDGSESISIRQDVGGSFLRPNGPTPTSHGGRLGKRYRKIMAQASVEAGWEGQWTFLTAEDKLDYPTIKMYDPPVYSHFWLAGEVGLCTLGTINDRQEKIDTPLDTIAATNYRNLSVQARTALTLVAVGLESIVDSRGPAKINKPKFGRLVGRVTQFNALSGIDAQEPVPGAMVYYPALKSTEEQFAQNTNFWFGIRKGIALRVPLNGNYVLPLEEQTNSLKRHVFAYHLDRDRGLMDKVADEGQIGTQKKKPTFKLLDGEDSEKKFILTDVYPWVFFPGPDPKDYQPAGGEKGGQYVTVIDAVVNGEPDHYGMDNPLIEYLEKEVASNILYMPIGRRARVMVRKNVLNKLLLVGNLSEEHPKGYGYYIGPLDGDRNVTLAATPMWAARDMLALARERNQTYSTYGVTDQAVHDAVHRAGEKYELATAAFDELDYQAANGYARESWGILIKAYSRILTLGREAVFSVVVLMGLLLPASVFGEKLLIGGKGIMARLIGSVILFVLGTVFLKFFHPAFQISISPFIVVIAFTMILMSVIVLTISYQRADVLLRRARAAGGEVESEEISLASSLSTALSLGVSNLKKRPARTFLTVFTVTVLTFSIVTFVSVKGRESTYLREVAVDARGPSGEGTVEPIPPAYEGVLFRGFYWKHLQETFVSALYSEFGSRFDMTTRAHYIETEGGNNADREGVNEVNVNIGRREHVLTGIMAFMPNETDFSGLHRAVSGGLWFRDMDPDSGRPGDRYHVILPDVAARSLGITEDDLLDEQGNRRPDDELPVVQMMNIPWKVIGVLDVDQADRMRDITGRSLAMVDYLKSAFSAGAAEGHLVNEPDSYYMSWEELAIIPYPARTDVEAKPRSVAIRFTDQTDTEQFQRDVAMRMNKSMFGHFDDKLLLITTETRQSVGGLAKIIVPVILCILIVLNTMMANVEERRGEVGMLGAIGLSPSQISFLLLSESTVFSVLGIVLGTFIGLLFANVAPNLLSGLSFNFTSLLSVGLAMGTGVVVLLATLIPARHAAAMAAPSGMGHWELPDPGEEGEIRFELPFTLTRGNAVGMMAFFRRFLLNHTDAASPGFNCRHIDVRIHRDNGSEALQTSSLMWLVPYDLDVSQHLVLRIVPTDHEGVFGVRIHLQRASGTEESWMRTNYGFMDLVRRQFLLWRNLDNDSRRDYIVEGAQLFQEQEA